MPYMEDGGSILSRKADPRPDLMRIFSPFSRHIWLATGGMVLVFGLVLFLINKYDPAHLADPPAAGQGPGQGQGQGQGLAADTWNMALSVWTIFSSFMEQGGWIMIIIIIIIIIIMMKNFNRPWSPMAQSDTD